MTPGRLSSGRLWMPTMRQDEGHQAQITDPFQGGAGHALVQDVPVGVAEDEHRAAEQRGQSAEQAAVDAEELDAKEGDGQIDGHFDQRMPAGSAGTRLQTERPGGRCFCRSPVRP